MKQYFFLIIIFFITSLAYIQAQSISFNGFTNWNIDKNIHQIGSNVHTSIKPYNKQDVQFFLLSDTLKSFNFIKKSSKDSFKKGQNYISIAPSLFLANNYDIRNQHNCLETGIGISTEILFANKIEFQLKYLSSNSSYNNFIDSIISEMHVIPGDNYAYGTKLGWCSRNLDFSLTYKLAKHFNVQVGKTKIFFGEGYRSLLLSDNAASYPMLKLTTSIWKIKYVNLYTKFNDISNSNGKVSNFKGKYAAMHYLSINLTKKINFSFFEAVVWQAKDSNSTRNFDVNYINPVVFYRPVEFSIGSPDNALMGFNLSYLFVKNQQFYAQLLFDEFNLKHIKAQDGWWANKQAFQLGFKSFDVFRISNLFFQTEYNYIRPYTYSHITPYQNYGHYNQALAHPLGANLKESVSFLRYKYKHFYFETQFTYILMGTDTGNVNNGSNIFLSYLTYTKEYNNYVGQGVQKIISYKEFRVYYQIFSQLDWNFYVAVSNYNIKSNFTNQKRTLFTIGLSSFIKKPFFNVL